MNREKLLEGIPEPDAIRSRLEENLRESRLLRRMLRLAQQKEELRQQSQGRSREGQHGA